MVEHTPGSRFQMRGIGDLMHPGCCAVCGNGVCESGYLDIGVFFDYEGQVYLCFTCLNEGAEAAGLLSDSEARYLKAMNEDLAKQTAEVKKELEAANERLKHYDALFSDRFAEHPDLGASNDVKQVAPQDGDTVKRFVPKRAQEQPVNVEPVKGEGDTDLIGAERSDSGGFNL